MIINIDDLSARTAYINAELFKAKCSVLMWHSYDMKQVKFTCVGDMYLAKKIIPEFEIKEDERKRKYAELIINYE